MARPKQKKTGGGFGRRGRGIGPALVEGPRRRWRMTLGALAILLVALFVRFYGLSHDLNVGNIYHPDTPKQIEEGERFLQGHYYFMTKEGNHDLDGYPYFNMHLVEYEWRGVSGVYSVFESLMGWRRQFVLPHEYSDLRMKLFVVTRISVCIMSALAVLAIFRIGLEMWGPLVGLLGAGLAALSPLSVESAHYAMSDSVMDLFACLTVLAALRMYRSERLIYPLLAGFLSALTFAAKYNGGIVLVFVALLHVLKQASTKGAFSGLFRKAGHLIVVIGVAGLLWCVSTGGLVIPGLIVLLALAAALWGLFSKASVTAASLIVLGALIGVVAAIPSLLIYPDRVVKGIVLFSRLASRFRELPPPVASGERSLFWYAASANASLMVRVTGIVVLIGAAAGCVVSAFRNRRHLLPGLLIGLYLVVVLLTVRFVKPYYFSALTLLFCLYVAVTVDWLTSLRKKLRAPGIALGVALAGVVLITSGVRVGRSDFFFWHMSSRRVATTWVDENIPPEFRVRETRYSLYGPDRYVEEPLEDLVVAASTIDQMRVADDAVALKAFDVEGKMPLTWFRNPGVTLWLLPGSEHLRGDFGMPVYQRVASATGNEWVFVDGAEFVRTGRMIELDRRTTRRLFVIPKAPDKVLIELRNGQTGNRVTLSFGGQVREVSLNPLERLVLEFERPKRMRLTGRPIYKFWARAPFPCQAEVAVTDEQKGVLYYNAGKYEQALTHLAAAWCPALDGALVKRVVDAWADERYAEAQEEIAAFWRRRPSITIAQMAVVAALCSGQDLEKLERGPELLAAVRADLERAGTSWFERFGVSSTYLNGLPYIELEAESLVAHAHDDPAATGDAYAMPQVGLDGQRTIVLNDLFLEPGAYRVTMSARVEGELSLLSTTPTVRMAFVDATGQITYDRAVVAIDHVFGPAYGDVTCTLRFADRVGPATLRIATDTYVPPRIDTIRIEPEYDETMTARDALVGALLSGDLSELEPLVEHVEPLLAYGQTAEGRGDVELALAAYEKAAEADAGSYKPYEAMRRIVNRLPDEEKAAVSAKLDRIKARHDVPEAREVSVEFKNGAELTRCRLRAEEFRPGDTVELTLYWSVPAGDAARFAGRDLFIHFLPQGAPKDQAAFQGDTRLVEDFGFDERLDRIRPVYRHRVRIPAGTAPGVYDIEVGIEIAMHAKRIRVVEAGVPHTNNSATIGSIRIVERASVPSS